MKMKTATLRAQRRQTALSSDNLAMSQDHVRGRKMMHDEWEQKRAQLRRDFARILGSFPKRSPTKFEVLEPKLTFSETQWNYIHWAGQEAHEDAIAPDEAIDNPFYRRLHIRYAGAIEGQPAYALLSIPQHLKKK